MPNHLTPSDIIAEHYYEKVGSPGWLRYVVYVHGNDVKYFDATGSGATRSFNRDVQRRLTPDEAKIEFPDEVIAIQATIAGVENQAINKRDVVMDALQPLLRLLLRIATGDAVGVGRPEAWELIQLLSRLGVDTSNLDSYKLTDRLEEAGASIVLGGLADDQAADEAMFEALKLAAVRLGKRHPSSWTKADHRHRDALKKYAAAAGLGVQLYGRLDHYEKLWNEYLAIKERGIPHTKLQIEKMRRGAGNCHLTKDGKSCECHDATVNAYVGALWRLKNKMSEEILGIRKSK